MKKVLLVFSVFIFSAMQSFAQDSKGYISVSVGLAAPMGDTADGIDSGLEPGLINFGCRFNETWGATFN